ncbi:MAG: 2-amino-4-hydroxy-6-hydroxymethyldihydropteridine diphosphokinase [Candidatus Omnitrophica bacterium]|nr:2-amino-4-hydroxy-6-hydroxymethyldihydropteridine diphosphokinase [Candidatus Omnitrophota bacterium]
MNQVIIGLGSNIEPKKNIYEAFLHLSHEFLVTAKTAFTPTKAIGHKPQPDFINGCVLIETPLSQRELTHKLKKIELDMGRIRTADKYAPRVIDLDVIVWNDEIVDQDVYQRDYLRKSVLELKPTITF